MVNDDTMVTKGALVSYGANFRLLGRQSARLVAQVLQGARPAEIPIHTPDTLMLAINLRTARAMDLTVPRSIVERADRIVE